MLSTQLPRDERKFRHNSGTQENSENYGVYFGTRIWGDVVAVPHVKIYFAADQQSSCSTQAVKEASETQAVGVGGANHCGYAHDLGV